MSQEPHGRTGPVQARPGYLVREAVPAEHEAIGDLVVRAYRAVGETDESYYDELRDVASRAAVVPVLAAIEEGSGRVLGAVTFVPGPGPFHEGEFGDAASIRMLAVEPDARGRGVGSALVEECLRRARAAGRDRVSLYTRPFMTAAHAMYERLGFERVRELDWEFAPGEWLHAYAIELR
jgi:ribosomal protein S18 acetylase RimI-like enzyme